MVDRPPFNPRAHCPKCFYDCVSTEFKDGLEMWNTYRRYALTATWDCKPPEHPDEYLARKCLRCGYGWREATEDGR